MGQKLYVVREEDLTLRITPSQTNKSDVLNRIIKRTSPLDCHFSIYTHTKRPALETYKAEIIDDCLIFNMHINIDYGMYIYCIETTRKDGIKSRPLIYGYIEVLPNLA